MYRTIEDRIWDDPKVKQLSDQGKLFFVYLIVNRHSHVSGIYHLPDPYITEDIGLGNRVLHTLWHRISDLELALRDTKKGVVWVKNAMRYQGHGEKNEIAAVKQIENLHNSFLINKFLDYYPTVKKRVSDTLLYTLYHRISEVGVKEQEQEQEQEQESETGTEEGEGTGTYARTDGGPSESEHDVITIPLNTNEEFPIRPEIYEEFVRLYPAVDVLEELRKYRAWAITNPKKRKTRKGILKSVNFWLADKQDKNGHQPKLYDSKPTIEEMVEIAARKLEAQEDE